MGILMALLASQALISGPAVVIDGDTLRVGAERIRLIGIDAPERSQRCGQQRQVPCGVLSSQWLERLVQRRTVRCIPTERDQYGRLLAMCRIGSIDIGGAAVAAGWAIAYRRYSDIYLLSESRARRARRGLWALAFQTPEAYRRTHPRF